MARGWESKSVEAQKEEAIAAKTASPGTNLTAEARQRAQKTAALLLARRRIVEQLQDSPNPRYSELLQQTLRDLDHQIERL